MDTMLNSKLGSQFYDPRSIRVTHDGRVNGWNPDRDNMGRGETSPNLEEPAEIGRISLPRLLRRRWRWGGGRISDADEGVVTAVDGEVAE